MRHRACKNGGTDRAAVWFGELRGTNRVLDEHSHWHQLAHTVERVRGGFECRYATMGATRPVPKLLLATLFYLHCVYHELSVIDYGSRRESVDGDSMHSTSL